MVIDVINTTLSHGNKGKEMEGCSGNAKLFPPSKESRCMLDVMVCHFVWEQDDNNLGVSSNHRPDLRCASKEHLKEESGSSFSDSVAFAKAPTRGLRAFKKKLWRARLPFSSELIAKVRERLDFQFFAENCKLGEKNLRARKRGKLLL